MSDDRITDLEIKIAFQEHALRELDDVVRGLMDRVDELQALLDEVRAEHRSAMSPLENERPPHYG